jgi:penicillin-binding protein 1C
LGDRSRRRWMPLAAIAVPVAAGAMLIAAGVAAVWIGSLGPAPLGERLEFSTAVVDRDGRLLRPYATTQGRWRLQARADGVDPRYLALLTAYEDKRFREHAGVDVFALMRATAQVFAHGHIVSGGSTLTMQVARLLEPRTERSLTAKLRQIVRAVEIERHLGKDEVLTLYLSMAPYGGNLEGIRCRRARLFRQGAEAADARRGGVAGGAAAVAGGAATRSLHRDRTACA